MDRNLINFYNEIEELKCTVRYNGAPKIFQESTADHTWKLTFMCIDLIEKYNIKLDIIITMKIALVHDLCEYNQSNDITMADVISGKISKEEKNKIEKEAMNNLVNKYNRKDIFDLWNQYETQVTNEARFVKLVDRIESMLHILDKLKCGHIIGNLTDDVVYADKYINNFPVLKPLLLEIKNQYKAEFKKIGLEWKDEYNLK